MRRTDLLSPIIGVSFVFAPCSVMAQEESGSTVTAPPPSTSTRPLSGTATADAPSSDHIVRPELRLIASEPDLAALPRTSLPMTAGPAPAARQTSSREAGQRSEGIADMAPTSPLGDMRDRIAALPTVPDIVLPEASKPLSHARVKHAWSFMDRVNRSGIIPLSPGWRRIVLVGGLAMIVAMLFWSIGKRRRATAAANDGAPIRWEPSSENEAALRAHLQARRADAAKKQAPPQLRHGFATLGEALVAMKTAATRPLPHPAAADPQRTLDA